ncbi:protein arginine methyltransferase NDUFAF7 homolog, mitochondrial-like isoform X1 [Artemia franciscana]
MFNSRVFYLQQLTRSSLRSLCIQKLSESSSLYRQLKARILATGPITVADYMKEVLTNPTDGYYINNDVFGKNGDFITSPEISQLFGEMTGVWLVNEWQKIGSPKPFQIVEFGPGRGTLIDDILRVFKKLKLPMDQINIKLIEVSPKLSEIQEKNLCGSSSAPVLASICYKQNTTRHGSQIGWYRQLKDVPEKFSIFLAHEFFDALPVHKFVKNEKGWREILVDFDREGDQFRFVVSRSSTPALKIYSKFLPASSLKEAEISPQSILIARDIARRIHEEGGIALITDYGHNGTKGDTFRGFRNHQLHDPLVDPGTADLTVDVDFSLIKKAVSEETDTSVLVYGPITQARFLSGLGIEQRLQRLLQNSSAEVSKDLISGYRMLTERDQMGERFKLLAFFPKVLQDHLTKFPPVSFTCV